VNHPISLWRCSAVARPAGRAAAASPASKAANRPAAASSAPTVGAGLLAIFVGWLALFGLLVVMPIAMLASGTEPAAVLGWMGMVTVAMAVSWFLERRRQAAELRRMPKPRRPTSPCAEAFQAKWGTTERCETAEETVPVTAWMRFSQWAGRWGVPDAKSSPAAGAESVPAFVVNELPSGDGVYDARVYTTVDALADAMHEAEAAGLDREQTIEVIAAAIRGAQPYRSSSKAAARQGRGSGPARVGRGGTKGYLGGGR